MKKVFLISLIIALAAGLIFGGCAKPVTTTPAETTPPETSPKPTTLTPKYGGILKIVWDGQVAPVVGWPADYAGGVTTVAQVCVETLLRGDNKGNAIPWLAESYKLADDLKSVTFSLRKGIKFHDGSDFNAQAAKWNLDNQISAKRAPYWTSVDIIDNYTIRVNFSKWRNTLISEFGDSDFGLGFMVSPNAFQEKGIDWVKQNPVGTGPFKFDSLQLDVGLKAVKNTDYWREGNPYLDAVEILFIMDGMTRLMYMQTGGADVVRTYMGKDAADYATQGLSMDMNIGGVYCLIPDTANTDSPWSNQKVREAVEYAIDREAIAEGLGYGYWKATYQIPGRSCAIYNPSFNLGRKYDPEKAKQLLAEAGYPKGFNTTIIAGPGSLNKDALTAMQANLLKVGIQAELEIPELPRFITYMINGWHNAAIFFGFISETNPNSVLAAQFDPASPMLRSWLRTPEWIEAYNANLSASTLNVELARAVTDIMTKDASIIPIHETGGGWAYQPYVMDAGIGTRGMIPYLNIEQIWLNK